MKSNAVIVVVLAMACWGPCGCKGKSCAGRGSVEDVPDGEVDALEPSADRPAYDGPLLGIESLEGTGSNEAYLALEQGLQQLGDARADHVKLGEAAGKLQKALEADPGLPEARYALARARSRGGDQSSAADVLIEAMRVCLPCTTGLEESPDLEALRASDEWPRVQEAHAMSRADWKEALGSSGTFVLVGIGREVRDPTSPQSVDPDRADRGRVYFYHEASARFLPTGLGRDVAGFVLDPAGQGLHALSWDGWTTGTDSMPPRYSGMRVTSLDLQTLSVRATALPGDVLSIRLRVQDREPDVLLLALDRDEGQQVRQVWYAATCGQDAPKLSAQGDGDWAPGPIDYAGSAENKDRCIERLDGNAGAGRYLHMDSFCGDHHPAVDQEPGELPPIDALLQYWPWPEA